MHPLKEEWGEIEIVVYSDHLGIKRMWFLGLQQIRKGQLLQITDLRLFRVHGVEFLLKFISVFVFGLDDVIVLQFMISSKPSPIAERLSVFALNYA